MMLNVCLYFGMILEETGQLTTFYFHKHNFYSFILNKGWGEDILHAPNYWGGVIKKPECPYKCLFSGRRDLAPYADAILFSPGSKSLFFFFCF